MYNIRFGVHDNNIIKWEYEILMYKKQHNPLQL